MNCNPGLVQFSLLYTEESFTVSFVINYHNFMIPRTKGVDRVTLLTHSCRVRLTELLLSVSITLDPESLEILAPSQKLFHQVTLKSGSILIFICCPVISGSLYWEISRHGKKSTAERGHWPKSSERDRTICYKMENRKSASEPSWSTMLPCNSNNLGMTRWQTGQPLWESHLEKPPSLAKVLAKSEGPLS